MSHIGNGLATNGRQSMPGQAHVVPYFGPCESLAQIMTSILRGLPGNLTPLSLQSPHLHGVPNFVGYMFWSTACQIYWIIRSASQSGLDLDLGTLQCSSPGDLNVRSLATSAQIGSFRKAARKAPSLSGRGLGLVAVEPGKRLQLYVRNKPLNWPISLAVGLGPPLSEKSHPISSRYLPYNLSHNTMVL